MEYFAYSQKAFLYKYVVMLSDTDQFKHMSFANYLKLMFLATDALFHSVFDKTFLSEKRVKLVNSRMQFKRQTVSGDNMLVKVNTSEVKGSRFTLLYTFMIEGTAELVGLGRQAFQLLNLNTQADEEVPSTIRTLLEPIRVNEEHLLYKY